MMQNVHHQMVPSPARLGLPNPNSPSIQNHPPKFSSQLPQSHHSNQQPNVPTATLPSSTLFRFRPLLSRAQSLMASVASRLFEVAPNRAHWVSAFRGSLPTFAHSQYVTLSYSEPSLPPRKRSSLRSQPSKLSSLKLLQNSKRSSIFKMLS